MKGSGSKNSPIAIDESEDEVLQEILDSNLEWNLPELHNQPRNSNAKRPLTERMSSGDDGSYEADHHEVSGKVENGRRTQKRGRPKEDLQNNPNPNYKQRNFPETLSKKARKRQRRLERRALFDSRQGFRSRQIPTPGSILQSRLPARPSWASQIMSYDMFDFEPQPAKFPSFPMTSIPVTPTFPLSSSWMSSDSTMHHFPNGDNSWNSAYSKNQNELDIDSASISETLMSARNPSSEICPAALPQSEQKNITSDQVRFPLPPKPEPPPYIPIGMNPEQDPSSKHGLFEFPSPSSSSGNPYIPNPARTLVIEQLPKSHRNPDFVNSWSRKACGALPVYVSINNQVAKALVEFATGELARKAWGSPRLGQRQSPTNSHKPKGKPRDDLIRVWWYRVDGIGAGAGVGEIEEGEIEGDVEIESLAKKETKKERKARLARERLVKQAKINAFNIATSTAQAFLPKSSLSPDPASFVPLTELTENVPTSWTSLGIPHEANWLPETFEPDRYRSIWPLADGMRDSTAVGASTCRDSSTIASSRSCSPVLEPADSFSVAVPSITVNATSRSHAWNPNSESLGEDKFSPNNSPTVPNTNQSSGSPSFPSIRHATVWPSNSFRSMSASVIIPSEPRATKMAPKEPSFAKRAMILRRKELEKKIALSRKESVLAMDQSELSDQPLDSSPAEEDSASQRTAMEERLRKLVLQSKKVKNLPSTASSTNEISNGSSSSSTQTPIPSPAPAHGNDVSLSPSISGTVMAPPNVAPSSSSGEEIFSLDDLAVSFITETIETCKAVPQVIAAHTTKHPVKSVLAIRQQRLEQYIAEGKMLMDQLKQARSKEEKDRILSIMRERSRTMEVEEPQKTAPTGSLQPAALPTFTVSATLLHSSIELESERNSNANSGSEPQLMSRTPPVWPNSHHGSGVFIVSDDEEDDSSDDAGSG